MPQKSNLIEQLPEYIRILHSNYKIKHKSDLEWALKGQLGNIDFNLKEIGYIDIGGSDTADVLIHEVLHGIYYAFDLGDDSEAEEHFVKTVATGIVTVMKDNPTLFPTFQKMIDEKAA